MSSQAPSPSSSDDVSDGQSDGFNAPPPRSSSRSPGFSLDGNDDDSSSPSPPSPGSSGGSRSSSPSSDSQDSSSSNSKGSRSSSSPPPSKSSPSPSSSPSGPSQDGGDSDSSTPPAPPSDESSSGDNGGSDSSPPPPPRSPPPQQSEDAEPPPSPSSTRSPPSQPRSSPPPPPSPRWSSSNEGQSGSPPPSGGQPSPSASASPPPPPANHSVVFIPVVSSSHPGAPPGLVAIAPPGSVGVMSAHLPGAQSGTPGGMQAGSPGSTSSGGGDGGGSTSSSSSQLHSSQAVNGQLAAAIAGAAVAGLLFVMIAIFFVVTRRRKKDGLVYHTDGSYYMHSGQLVGSNHPSGVFYGPPPPGASGGFSYGPLATPGPPGASDSFRGAGYYPSGSLEQQQAPPGSNKSSFSYEELTSITSNFARDNVIGEGGFGCVYKGWLADGKCVAVKQLKAGSGQGEREFQAEVEIISRVHHRHLVSLVGYCVAQHHRMLIYEFVPNGTLEHHLHGRGVPVMDWPTRLRIAIGAAKGLAYLHEDCHPRIIHRDIKSANILLDYSFEAQVADFGLAKLSNDTHTHVSTRIMGTFGYLAPEYASSGKLTDRSDVFSFGVVLLELITGRKPVDQDRPLGEESLVEWARPVLADAIERGEHDELVDPRLLGRYNKAEMVRMVEAAAACVRHSAPKRPRMVQVMRALDVDVDEGSMADLSNGVKVGQSQVFNSSQQEAALDQLRRTAFASEEFTGEFEPSREYGASDSRPMNRRPAG